MGIALRLMSRVNVSSLSISGMLRRIFVSSTGTLFQAYLATIPAETKVLVVTHSTATIVTFLFKKAMKMLNRESLMILFSKYIVV